MWVAGEEQGLLGSRAMAAVDRKNGVDVVAMLTMDIVGGVAGGNGKRNRGHIRLFSEGVPSGGGPPGTPPEQAVAIPVPTVVGSDNDAPSRQLARTIKELCRLYVPDLEVTLVFRQDRYLRGGDHKAYNEQGYTAVRFSDRYEHFDRQHQDVRVEDGRPYGDLIEHIDFVNLADVTRLNVAAVMALALAPPAPTGVVLDIRQLSHDTRVAWDDPGDMRTVGYRVRMRPTWAPEWSERVDLGRVFEHPFKGISKDDVVFAVEAYDVDGNTSIPVYPTPRRWIPGLRARPMRGPRRRRRRALPQPRPPRPGEACCRPRTRGTRQRRRPGFRAVRIEHPQVSRREACRGGRSATRRGGGPTRSSTRGVRPRAAGAVRPIGGCPRRRRAGTGTGSLRDLDMLRRAN